MAGVGLVVTGITCEAPVSQSGVARGCSWSALDTAVTRDTSSLRHVLLCPGWIPDVLRLSGRRGE